MEEVIDLASNSEFSNFSKKVKQSLEDKLRNNATMKDNASKLNKFTDMADKFKEIAGVTDVAPTNNEPEQEPAPATEEPNTEVPTEPEATETPVTDEPKPEE